MTATLSVCQTTSVKFGLPLCFDHENNLLMAGLRCDLMTANGKLLLIWLSVTERRITCQRERLAGCPAKWP
jgi:hypothetical protein